MSISYIAFDELEKFMTDVLVKMGVPYKDSEIVAKVLIGADKRGIDSHGVGRFKPIYIDRIDDGTLNPITKIDIVSDRDATAVLDANNGLGHVAGKFAMDMAIEKARRYGVGMVTVRNSSHYGFAGYYSMMAIEAGMVGITGTNARPSTAPTFGVENMLGTNPLTIGLPTSEPFDFIIDCATSTSQRGKIEKYAREDKELPKGWVIDHEGNSKTNPKEVLADLVNGKAALTPLGGIGEDMAGYKGYGYATAVEILSSALHGGPFMKALNGMDAKGNKAPYRLGHFFIAVDISHFTDLESFREHAGSILYQLRNSEKAPGCNKIYTAGEKEYLVYLEREDKGVPVNEVLMKEIVGLRERFSL